MKDINYLNKSIFFIIKKIWNNLAGKRKIQIFFLFLVMILSSFLEIFSIASIIPIIDLFINPDQLFKNKYLLFLSEKLNISDPVQILLPIISIFIIITIFASIIKVLNNFLNFRLSALIGNDFSCIAYKNILDQDYKFHISKNSSEFISTIVSEIKEVSWVINLSLQFLTSTILSFGIVIAGLIYNFYGTFLTVILFSLSYIVSLLYSRNKLNINSKIVSMNINMQLKSLKEGFGLIREIIINNNQIDVIKEYRDIDKKLRIAQMDGMFIGMVPKYFIESLGLIIIICVGYVISINSVGRTEYLTALAAITVGAQKLLPLLQSIFGSWAGIRSNSIAVKKVITLIEKRNITLSNKKINLEFKDSIRLRNVSFAYSNKSPLILDKINLEIKKGQMIGIIGKNGSGKSTLIDILMGLLYPVSGEFYVDKKLVNKSNIKQWRELVSHVPQDLFLMDSSFEKNICLKDFNKEIDNSQLINAAEKANIIEFIKKQPYKFKGKVGESGNFLSGGQKQRIGLARALYKNSKILFLDEATNAIDSGTEKFLIHTLRKFDQNLTIIIITHNTKNLKNCDQIFELNSGKIINCPLS